MTSQVLRRRGRVGRIATSGLAALVVIAGLLTGVSEGATAAAADWPTYHHDAGRTGADAPGVDLSLAGPEWTSATLDGGVYAEPLVVGSNVIVATEQNTLYVIDAATGTIVRSHHFGSPVPITSLPCGNINPLGITGTPVFDPGTGMVCAVAELNTNPLSHHLVGYNPGSGVAVDLGNIDPPGMADPTAEQQRAALTVANGKVYVAFGGLAGDCGNYSGWVVRINETGAPSEISFKVPVAREGGIWAPAGPSIDQAGNLYVAVGNGSSTTTYDGSDSVTKLSPDLTRLALFAPSTWPDDNANDLDLGSTGPEPLANNRIFQVGKRGIGYLLDGTNLGGVGGTPLDFKPVCAAFGGDAYVDPYIYVPCTNGVKALRLQSGTSSFSVAWQTTSGANGPPVVGGGLVWSVNISNGTLYGLDPTTGTTGPRIPLARSSISPPRRFPVAASSWPPTTS